MATNFGTVGTAQPRLIGTLPRSGARASGPGIARPPAGPRMQQSPPLSRQPSSRSPAGPATVPPPNGLPYDPVYQGTLNLNQTNYQNTLTGLDAQQNNLYRDYGFNAQGQFDPSNPFSRAALLSQAYQQNQNRSTNSYAARGQLYAGSLQNAQDTNSRNYNQGYNTLKTGFGDALAAIAQARTNAQTTKGGADLGALGTSLTGALNSQATSTQPAASSGSPTMNVSLRLPRLARTGRVVNAPKPPKKR